MFQSIKKEDLKSALIKEWQDKGYVLKQRRTKPNKVFMTCALSGLPENRRNLCPKTRIRNKGTKLCNCPFSVNLVYRIQLNTWERVDKCLEHNHDPSSDLTGHSSIRRLKEDEKKAVETMRESGIGASQILNVLKNEFSNTVSGRKEIHNHLSFARNKFLNGRSPMKALLDTLYEGPYKYYYALENNGSVKSLFFSHHQSIQLCKRFGKVFIADCTYKTNQFNMPLLNIVGITSTFHTFNAGFIFLSVENFDNYKWALEKFKECLESCMEVISTDKEMALINAIKSVFPNAKNFICTWHISKNILAHCKPHFSERDESLWENFISEWNVVVESKTIQHYERNWESFELNYISIAGRAIDYIKQNWLPWKESFIACYTNKHLHLGSRSTSRGEGSHFVFKRQVNLAKCDLLTVYKSLHLMLENQFKDIKKYAEQEKLNSFPQHSHDIFKNLRKFHVLLWIKS